MSVPDIIVNDWCSKTYWQTIYLSILYKLIYICIGLIDLETRDSRVAKG